MIPAGGSGKLTARVHTNIRQSGRLTKSVAVSTDNPKAQPIRLSMSFNVVTPIIVKPSARLYLRAVRGEAASDRILLHRTDGKALQVELPEPAEEDNFKITTVKVKKAEPADQGPMAARPGDVWIEASLEPEAKAVYTTRRLLLKTNHPQLPELVVPLTVRVRDLIEARPSSVQLWASPGAAIQSGTIFRVTHNSGQQFMVKGIEVSHPKLFTATFVGRGAARAQNIRVTLADGVTAAQLERPVRGTIVLAFDDPGQGSLEVPVTVGTRSAAAAVREGARHRRETHPALNLPPPATPVPGSGE